MAIIEKDGHNVILGLAKLDNRDCFLYMQFCFLKANSAEVFLNNRHIMLDDHKKTDRKSFAVFKKNANFMKTKQFSQHFN